MVATRPASADAALMIIPMADLPGARLVGDVDLATAPTLQTALDELLAGDGAKDLHLDLAGLRFVDVNGAAALVAVGARLGPEHALVLHGPSPALTQMLGRFWDGVARIRIHVS